MSTQSWRSRSPKQRHHLQEEADVITFDDNGDSRSDVSMSEGSADDDASSQHRIDIHPREVPAPPSNWRSSEANFEVSQSELSECREIPDIASDMFTSQQASEKVKLDAKSLLKPGRDSSLPSDRSLLPPELWHHIFTFTPPRTLGTLLRVNRIFNVYLDPLSSVQCPIPQVLIRGSHSRLIPDAIWQASRRRYWPQMPAPMKDRSELDMWRVACAKKCQFCGKLSRDSSPSTEAKSKSTSDAKGQLVKIIWPFNVSSCNECLLSNSSKEIDILLSSALPTLLLPALPFVLLTAEMKIISSVAFESGQPLGNGQLTKIFLTKDITTLNEEFSSVRELGPGTAEEWIKGLEDRGKERRLDAARWERWESAGGISKMRNTQSAGETVSPISGLPSTEGLIDATSRALSPHNSDPQRVTGTTNVQKTPRHSVIGEVPHLQKPLSIHAPQQANAPRSRTREEVLELKASRRAEIERRAMMLEPPLTPSILTHIPSFQAALQIILPLDDFAWNMLKPRLLAQRADAEHRALLEQESTVQSRNAEERRTFDAPKNDTKELSDKDWDDAQAPLRAQISLLADETIRKDWEDGRKINKENAPMFAVEVLLYVRRRFYADVDEAAAAASAVGVEPIHDSPQGPFTQKLTLENMKWIFDAKVKPHTESFRKELFLCNGCDDTLKVYGFEGVVQHYAAKHTHALSRGSVIVHWRAEWPEVPPFCPDPQARISRSTSTAPNPSIDNVPTHQRHVSYGTTPLHVTHQPYHGAAYNPNQYRAPNYQNIQASAFGLQGLHTAAPSSQGHYHYPQQPTYAPAYNPPFPGISGPYPPPVLAPGVQQPISAFTNSFPAPQLEHHSDAYHRYGHREHVGPPGVFQLDKIHAQLEDLAQNSRQLWMSTSGLKELPGNVRVCVILHHLAKRYRSRFWESPPLTMFIDGLSNNKEMRPVRNVNGLKCKSCQLSLGPAQSVQGERITFSLPQLVNHFQQRHIEPIQATHGALLDWTVDMVYVPDLSILSSLRAMNGMDDHKISLISEAFAFETLRKPDDIPTTSERNSTVSGSHDGGTALPSQEMNVVAPEATLASKLVESSWQHGLHGSDDLYRQGAHSNSRHDLGDMVHVVRADHEHRLPSQPLSQLQVKSLQDVSLRRSSPERKKRPFGRKGSAKDRSEVWGPGAKKHKTRTKDRANTPSQAINIEDGFEHTSYAEEEEQLQEDAIRAMWAADRAAVARPIPAPGIPPEAIVEDPNRSASMNRARQPTTSPRPFGTTAAKALVSTTPIRRQSLAIPVPAPEEDLFAGLEYHLDQQVEPSAEKPLESEKQRRPLPAIRLVDSSNGPVQRAPPSNKCNGSGMTDRPSYDRDRMQSPIRSFQPEIISRYPQDQTSGSYFDQSANTQNLPRAATSDRRHNMGPTAMAYNDRHAQSPLDHKWVYRDDQLERPSSFANHRSSPYVDETRRRPTSPIPDTHSEAYELILMRDTQGEYYIRRPIRRGVDSVIVRQVDGERFGHNAAQVWSYEQDVQKRAAAPDFVQKIEPASHRYVVHDDSSRRIYTAHQPRLNTELGVDHMPYEEYDPRFPAATSNLDPGRFDRYEE